MFVGEIVPTVSVLLLILYSKPESSISNPFVLITGTLPDVNPSAVKVDARNPCVPISRSPIAVKAVTL